MTTDALIKAFSSEVGPLPAYSLYDTGGPCDANDIYASVSQTIHFFISFQGPPQRLHTLKKVLHSIWSIKTFRHKWESPQHCQLAEEVSKESILSMLSSLSSNGSAEKLVLEHGRLEFQS